MDETHTVLSKSREFLHNEWKKIVWEALLESLLYVSLASVGSHAYSQNDQPWHDHYHLRLRKFQSLRLGERRVILSEHKNQNSISNKERKWGWIWSLSMNSICCSVLWVKRLFVVWLKPIPVSSSSLLPYLYWYSLCSTRVFSLPASFA